MVRISATDRAGDARPVDAVYYGIVRVIPQAEYLSPSRAEWDIGPRELAELIEPLSFSNVVADRVPGLPIERIVTFDRNAAQVIVLWRVPFQEVRP